MSLIMKIINTAKVWENGPNKIEGLCFNTQ